MEYLEELEEKQRFYDDLYDEEEEDFVEQEDQESTEDQMSPAKSKYDSNQLKLDIATARERVYNTFYILCLLSLCSIRQRIGLLVDYRKGLDLKGFCFILLFITMV